MLQAYRAHVAERAALGIPPLPLTAQQTGELIELLKKPVDAKEGEFLVVPRGVEHRPVAEEKAQVLLFEPASTLNTGNVQNERTFAQLDRI